MNDYNLKDRRAIVTGGAQGFGYAITKRFLESGAEVIIWDIDQKAIDEALKQLSSNKCSYQIVDVTNFDDITESIKKNTKEKNIDIFVNNAGMAGKNTQVWNYPNEEWLKVMNLDLNSVFYCCKAIVPHMIKNNYGRIVNIASIAGKEGNPKMVPYSATKAGVIGLTKSVGKELAETGIRVNCVTPAVVKTKILDQIGPEVVDYMVQKIPMKRTVEISEVASLVHWLASPDCSASTGAVFDISGGRATY